VVTFSYRVCVFGYLCVLTGSKFALVAKRKLRLCVVVLFSCVVCGYGCWVIRV